MNRIKTLAFFGFAAVAMIAAQPSAAQAAQHRAIKFVGGFETDPRDGGRPVILVAGGLGIPAEVFREAFSHVRPARGGEPEPAQIQQNKHALLSALGRYGVTNDRLDEVSNYYRYMASRGEMWRHIDAAGYATVVNGKVTGFTVTSAGAGYSSAPAIVVEGLGEVNADVVIAYGKNLATNGSIQSISIGHKAVIQRSSSRQNQTIGLEEALRLEAIPREVIDRLNLTADQQRRLAAIPSRTSDRRELHEQALAVLTASQRALIE